MTERCISCRFWLVDPAETAPDPESTIGWCRRYPPIVLDHLARMTIPHLGHGPHNYDPEDVATITRVHSARIFPATYGTEWCGEYQPKEDRSW